LNKKPVLKIFYIASLLVCSCLDDPQLESQCYKRRNAEPSTFARALQTYLFAARHITNFRDDVRIPEQKVERVAFRDLNEQRLHVVRSQPYDRELQRQRFKKITRSQVT
jgi:predicted KAP-like P-loop ATPase